MRAATCHHCGTEIRFSPVAACWWHLRNGLYGCEFIQHLGRYTAWPQAGTERDAA